MNGIYVGAMGMMQNMLKLEVVSQNIANASTDGYKSDSGTFKVFDETNQKETSKGRTGIIGGYENGVYMDHIHTNFQSGTYVQSNQPYDMALSDGNNSNQTSFFVVQLGNQTFLTRNGGFQLNGNRQLSTLNGALVLDSNNNPITMPTNVNTMITKDGQIKDSNTGKTIATLKLTTVNANDLGLLEKKFGGFYQPMTYNEIVSDYGNINNLINQFNNDPTIRSVFGSAARLQNIQQTGQINIFNNFSGEVKNHMKEASNVDLSQEFVNMMQGQRGVEVNQKVMTTFDKIFEKEANDLGR